MHIITSKKTKYLQDIQKSISSFDMDTALKNLLRHQSLFRFKSGDEESIDFYLTLINMGSYKLLNKLMLAKLDATVLERESLDNETIIKMIVFARVLAAQGLNQSSKEILKHLKKFTIKLSSPCESQLYYKSLFYVHFHNMDIEQCQEVLEQYKAVAENKAEKLYFYHSSRLSIFFIQKNITAAETEFKALQELIPVLTRPYHQTYHKVYQFMINILHNELDESGYIATEEISSKLVGEVDKLFIMYIQLRYLIRLDDHARLLEHVEKIYHYKELDGSACGYLRKDMQEEFKKSFYLHAAVRHTRLRLEILRQHNARNEVVELTSSKGLNVVSYFELPFHSNQLDLRAGVIVRNGKLEPLTELQRCFLYHVMTAGDNGIKWIMLAEAIHGPGLRFDLHFESLRKMAAKLRSLGINITYKDERYRFVTDLESTIFALHFIPGNLVLYIARHFKQKSFTADEISSVLGFKKSRTGEYILDWLESKKISQLAVKGKQKHYIINYAKVNPLNLPSEAAQNE